MYTKTKGVLIFGFILMLANCQVKTGTGQTVTPIPTLVNLNNPLPVFIFGLLVPGPEAVIPLENYRNGYHYPIDAHPPPGNAKNSICAQIDPAPLLEPGDDGYSVDRVKLYIDGSEINMYSEYFEMASETVLFDDMGQIVATAGGPLVLCWVTTLDRGKHIATITAQKTSGEKMDYSWSFEITNE